MQYQTKGTFPFMDELEFKTFLESMKRAEYVALDTESNGKDLRAGEGYTMGVSVAFRVSDLPVLSAYFPYKHPDRGYDSSYLKELNGAITNIQCMIMHNAKHDLEALENIGVEYTGPFYDTMLMAHLLNENYWSKGLDYLGNLLVGEGKKRGYTMDAFIKAFGWDMAPSWMIYEYAEQDTIVTLKLFEFFKEAFENELPPEIWEKRQKFVRLLQGMERQGILIDKELSQRELRLGRAKMKELQEALNANPASPKDLEKLLITKMGLPVVARTKTGKISFNKKAMQTYEEMLEESKDETATKILEYRGYQKTCSSNYEAYLKLAGSDGRLHANYKLHGTKTGRLSCEDPNLQQIPRVSDKPWNGNLKQAFIAEKYFELWEADYKNLELRLAAAYAKEQSLLKAFKEGRDVFTEIAKTLGISRQDAKTLVYATLYGAGLQRLALVFNVDLNEAKRIRENFFYQYPGLRTVSQRASNLARSKGYVQLWSGRRRHFESKEDAHKAFNSVVQGGAADIVMDSMIRLNEVANNNECRMLLTVHDSVVFELREDKKDLYLPIIKETMEAVTPDFGVHFDVDIKRWGE